MTARIAMLFWGALALMTAGLLARNALAIPVLAPLDPNEGWNATHALSLLAGKSLYPPPQSLMVNNYPPLSFYLVAGLSRFTGDAVIAGRVLSLLAFLCSCVGIALVMRRMSFGVHARWAAVLFFAATLSMTSGYVGMDDPQLLGHAVQLSALLLALRGRPAAGGVVFAVSLFVKHNLLALPLACAWLLWRRDRNEAARFALSGFATAGLGLVLFRLAYGVNLWAVVASSRLTSLANVQTAVSHLWWAALPLAALLVQRDPRRNFCLIYVGMALATGVAFSAGDGVDVNIFFDLAIADAFALGMIAEAGVARAALCALPLPLFLIANFHDNNFFYSADFRAQSARDVAFLQSRPGPALCDQLSLCLWAGKGAQVDVFNAGEQIKTGARDPAPLSQMIAAHHFAVVQLQDPDGLGSVGGAVQKYYHAHHSDDSGTFFTPAL